MLGSLNKGKLVDLFLKIEGVPHRGKMSVDCSGYDTETKCNNAEGCGWNSNGGSGSGACECGAGYGGTNANACTKCEGTSFKEAVGIKACDTCSGAGAAGIPGSVTS